MRVGALQAGAAELGFVEIVASFPATVTQREIDAHETLAGDSEPMFPELAVSRQFGVVDAGSVESTPVTADCPPTATQNPIAWQEMPGP